jgi:hypothetical protein
MEMFLGPDFLLAPQMMAKITDHLAFQQIEGKRVNKE